MPGDAPIREDAKLERSLGRWLWWGIFLLVLLVAAFPAYRAVEGTRRAEALAERQAAEIATGRQLWLANCAGCHGRQGQGAPDTPALNAKEFFEVASEQQIHHSIQAGVPGTEMPAWSNEFGGQLTDAQVRAIVAFILSWEKTAPSRPDWRAPKPPPTSSPAPTPSPAAEVTITVDNDSCGPLEVRAAAGRRLVLRYRNTGSAPSSLDIEALGQHIHARPGQTTRVRVTPLQAGTYGFECLGSRHGQVLGVGEIRAS